MRGLKKLLNEIFIDGLSGMASGLFATLIIGTIIQQVGNLMPGAAGTYLFMVGKLAAAVTGAGIGCGAALRLKAGPLVMLSAAAAGMTGAFAGKITEGAVLVEGTICLSGPGEPLGAFIAAIVGIYAGRLVTGKTKIDILVTPLACIVPGAAAGLVFGAFTSCRNAYREDFGPEELLRELFRDWPAPVVYNLRSAHCSPMVTLPLGAACTLDGDMITAFR